MSTEAKETPHINTHVRLFDLVRYHRAELHREGLITDEEYGFLCAGPMAMSPKGGSPSRHRLEDYDELRVNLSAALAENAKLREALQKVEAKQPEALKKIEANGFVFNDIGCEPGNWQHLAFTLYTDLCELRTEADAAMRKDGRDE